MNEEVIKKEIISLCLTMFGTTKEEIKIHNKNTDRLDNIYFDLTKNNSNISEKIYINLLDFPDDRVKFYAAVCCLKMKKNVIKAKKTLKRISSENSNPNLSFSADIALDLL